MAQSSLSYILQFSWCKITDEFDGIDLDSESADAMIEVGNRLASCRPMLSCVFNNNSDSPPSLSEMHKVIQSEYINATDDLDTNETYGMLLDTLRRLHINSIKAQKFIDESGATESKKRPTAQPLVLTLNVGALIANKETACMLHLSEVPSFQIVSKVSDLGS